MSIVLTPATRASLACTGARRSRRYLRPLIRLYQCLLPCGSCLGRSYPRCL